MQNRAPLTPEHERESANNYMLRRKSVLDFTNDVAETSVNQILDQDRNHIQTLYHQNNGQNKENNPYIVNYSQKFKDTLDSTYPADDKKPDFGNTLQPQQDLNSRLKTSYHNLQKQNREYLLQREQLGKSGETSNFGNVYKEKIYQNDDNKFSFSLQRSPNNVKYRKKKDLSREDLLRHSQLKIQQDQNSPSIGSPGADGLYQYNPNVVQNGAMLQQSRRVVGASGFTMGIEGSFAPKQSETRFRKLQLDHVHRGITNLQMNTPNNTQTAISRGRNNGIVRNRKLDFDAPIDELNGSQTRPNYRLFD